VKGPILITPEIFEDKRGYFMENWNQSVFDKLVKRKIDFIKDCLSYSKIGVIRGLHYQLAPFQQDKLITCLSGCIFDVLVDLRKSSETYKSYIGIELRSRESKQIFIPKGFAHGFLTLSENAKVFYKIAGEYSLENQRSLKWDDQDISINWPLGKLKVITSKKDNLAKSIIELENEFE
tara:strand:- start:441 stop:974 length:534 start_codon:yes stop_codon:yes gene_type:complete